MSSPENTQANGTGMHEVVTEQEPSRDRTWLAWGGVVLVLALMVGALALRGEPKPDYSYVEARHILVKCNIHDPVERGRAMERIREITGKLESGEPFGRLAEKYSDDELSAVRGGDLGRARRGEYVGEFEAYVWEGPVGKVGGPVPTVHGLHLILIEDRYLTEIDRLRRDREQQRRERETPGAQG